MDGRIYGLEGSRTSVFPFKIFLCFLLGYWVFIGGVRVLDGAPGKRNPACFLAGAGRSKVNIMIRCNVLMDTVAVKKNLTGY